MTAAIYTLGCRVNQYESEAIAQALRERGMLICPPEDVCDAYIINTCTVTAESSRKARQFIRRARSKNPSAFILVTGCYSQTEPEVCAAIDGVDYVCGTANKMSVVDVLASLTSNGAKRSAAQIDIPDLSRACFERMSISSFGRTRAYVKIEDGCENRCAYCIIPRARGRVRSKSPDDVINEVRDLIAHGYPEIVLTGIETAAYGRELGCDLIDLLKRIDELDGIKRIRLGSLDPSYAGERFARFAADSEHLCAHFHLSLQSGCDRTLAAMRRKYNTAQARENIARLRAAMPGVNFSADIIVGFPGESEEDFAATCSFVREIELLHGHVFSYSRRRGTEADKMPDQIAETVKSERNRILTGICEKTALDIARASVGSEAVVLFETYEDGMCYGHTDNFLEVGVPTDENLHGRFCRVKITDAGRVLTGKLLGDAVDFSLKK